MRAPVRRTLPEPPAPGGRPVRLSHSPAQGCFLVAVQSTRPSSSSSSLGESTRAAAAARRNHQAPQPHSIMFVRCEAAGAGAGGGGRGGGGNNDEGAAASASHPGIDAAFVGVNDACFAVLEPRGVSVAVYPCNAPAACMARYVLDVPASRVFPGPNPANALAAATSESFGILRMTGAGGGGGAGGSTPHGRGTMAPAAGDGGRAGAGGGSARLAAGEAVVQVMWQGFSDDAGGVAVLTDRRLLLMVGAVRVELV